MEEPRVGGGLLFKDLDTALANPSPHFACNQSRKHDQEECANLLSEDGHRQACLCNGKPCFLVELLDLDGTERAETKSLKAVDKSTVDNKHQIN